MKRTGIKISKSVIIAAAGSLLLYTILVLLLSGEFNTPNFPPLDLKIGYTAIRILLGIILFAFFLRLLKSNMKKETFFALVGIGLVVRILLSFSTPIMEDDYYRYLWDGAVTANYINPYEYSPESARSGEIENLEEREILRNLSEDAGEVYERINHPQIRTIYPMGAQLVFAVSYLLDSWSVVPFKLIAVILDACTFFLIILILRQLKFREEISLIYWLNPLVVQEFFNGAHMDFIIFPFMLASIYFLLRKRDVPATIFLVFAAAVKVWPIVFLPFFLKKNFKNWKISALHSFLFSALVILLYLPVFITQLDSSLGFVRYAGNWYNNDAVFRLLTAAFKWFAGVVGLSNNCSHCNTRFIVVGIYLTVLICLFVKSKSGDRNFLQTLSLAVIAMFLISPTQFPWYYTWILPLLVFSPRVSILLYIVALPLYQQANNWDWIVYIEHLPILLLFLLEISGKIFKWFDTAQLLNDLPESEASKSYISG